MSFLTMSLVVSIGNLFTQRIKLPSGRTQFAPTISCDALISDR